MTNAAETPHVEVASPCTGVCRVDSEDMCLGCGRQIDEIVEWSRASEARRRVIVTLAAERGRRKGLVAPA